MSEPDFLAYGCIFCITGKEQYVADNIQRKCAGVSAITARQEKYRTEKGVKRAVVAPIFPSYVFFKAPPRFDALSGMPWDGVCRVLEPTRGDWRLRGDDLRFAQWLFKYSGLLSFSKAYKEGDQIKISSGPLKDMEGSIRKLDRRGRSCQVTLNFNGRSVNTWLGYELIEADDAALVSAIKDRTETATV